MYLIVSRRVVRHVQVVRDTNSSSSSAAGNRPVGSSAGKTRVPSADLFSVDPTLQRDRTDPRSLVVNRPEAVRRRVCGQRGGALLLLTLRGAALVEKSLDGVAEGVEEGSQALQEEEHEKNQEDNHRPTKPQGREHCKGSDLK